MPPIKNLLVTVAVAAVTAAAVGFISGGSHGSLVALEGKNVSTLNTPAGRFLFSVRGRDKTDKGYKFGFTIGNSNYADYEGLTLRVSWGKKPATKDEKVTMASQDIKLSKIEAGQLKNIDVFIPTTNENDLQVINVNIVDLAKVSLAK